MTSYSTVDLTDAQTLEEVMGDVARELGSSIMGKMLQDIKSQASGDCTKHISKTLRVFLRVKTGGSGDDSLGVRVEEVPDSWDAEQEKARLFEQIRRESMEFCDNLLERCMKELQFLRDALKTKHGVVYCSVCRLRMASQEALQCTLCRTPYCSEACQKQDWKHHNHKLMCGSLSRLCLDI